MNNHTDLTRIFGSGGGGGKGGKGGGSGGSSNSPNTLRSRAKARMVELISEGEIEGLVAGAKSIYFDQTPVENADGSFNFKNVIWSERKGTPDQEHIAGNNTVETAVSVEVQVKASTGPVQRTIVDQNADALRVIVRIPALAEQDTKNGGIKGASLGYIIEVRASGGPWVKTVEQNFHDEKTTSPFQMKHEFDLPYQGSPWDVRVRRTTGDSGSDGLQSDLFFEGYVILVKGKYIYPNSALVGLEVNAEDMGSNIPARSFRVRGLKVNVPTNYNPVTRAYTGVWDGTFKIAWTNNPTWVFYDLVVNDRYGLGEFVNAAQVDKWSLYSIAQYCDQLVPSGYKNTVTNTDIMEPRFTFNGVINSRKEAFEVLRDITSAWRGMGYWATGQIFATADMPSDPVKIVAPANIINGEFTYSGTAMKARHSVIIVGWNNPDDFYRADKEVVINDTMLQQFGWREKTVQLNGCTSRGQAHRYGKWVLDTEQNETETVEYSASWDHADVRPGDVIAVADPNKAQVQLGGRVVSAAGKNVVLDRVFTPVSGNTYYMLATLPTGAVERQKITSFTGVTATLETAFSVKPETNSMFAITGTDITPRNYRVITVEETEPHIFKVTALFHDPLKFARVEQNVIFDPLPYSRPSSVVPKSTNLQIKEYGYLSNGVQVHNMLLSWSPPDDQTMALRGYIVYADTPEATGVYVGTTQGTSIEFFNAVAGEYTFHVQTINFTGVFSEPADVTFMANGSAGYALPTVTDLGLKNTGGSQFSGRDFSIVWKNNFAASTVGGTTDAVPQHISSPHYSHNILKIYHGTGGQLLRTVRTTEEIFMYDFESNKNDCTAAAIAEPARSVRIEVTVHDVFGRTSVPVSRIFNNPQPIAIAPTYVVASSSIFLSYANIDDPDFAGLLVWRSLTAGVSTAGAPLYDGKNNPVEILGDPNTTYYFKVAAYDAFGKTGLNYSSEFAVTTLSDSADTTPPALPTGLAVTSSMVSGVPRVVATWNANTEGDLGGYDLDIKQGAGGWVSFTSPINRHEFNGLPGISYDLRVRARDKYGNLSAYTATVTHVAIKDSTPPAVPASVVATAAFKAIWLTWGAVADADLDRYEVYSSTTTTAPTAATAASFTIAGTAFVHSGLAAAVLRYYWVRSVDTSGNKSAWSARVNATTLSVQSADITGAVNSTSFAAGLTAIEIITGSTLPTTGNFEGRQVFLTGTGKTYRYTGGAFTAAVPAADITGAVTAEQIATNAIDNSKLATGLTAVEILGTLPTTGNFKGRQAFLTTDSKLYRFDGTAWVATISASDVTGALSSEQIGQIDAAKIIGQITAAQLAAGAVDATKLASNLKTIEVVSALPTTGNSAGRVVFLTTDSKLYRFDGTAWTASIPATDMTGTITGTQIADNAITTPKIAAGAVITGHLTAGAVTANEIASNAITTGHITAGAVKTEQISAGAITANKMTIGDFTNVIPNANFANDLAGWTATAAGDSTVAQYSGSEGIGLILTKGAAHTAQIDVRGADRNTTNPSFDVQVKPGDVFFTRCKITRVAGTNVSGNMGVYAFLKYNDGRTPTGHQLAVTNNVAIGTTTTLTGTFTIPADANSINFQVYYGVGTSSAGGQIIITDISTRRMNGGELIVDGAISASKITTGAITTEKIAAGAVVADSIAANAITSPKIEAGAVNADKLAANSVTADKVLAGAINAGHIAANSITAKQLVISDFSNLLPDHLLSDFSLWTNSNATWSIIPGTGNDIALNVLQVNGPYSATGTANGFITDCISKEFPVEPGKQYTFGGTARVNNFADYYGATGIVLTFLDASSTSVQTQTVSYSITDNNPISNSLIVTVPPTAVKATIRARRARNAAGAYGGVVRFYNMFVRRAANAELIVDGSITANHLSAQSVTASKLVITSETGNLYPDFDCQDASMYSSSTGNPFSLIKTTTASLGLGYVNVGGAGNQSLETQWCVIEPGTDYIAKASVWMPNGPFPSLAKVEIELGTIDASAVVTPTRRIFIQERNNASSYVPAAIDFKTSTTERRFRFVGSRNDLTPTGNLRMGAFQVRRKADSTLIADGAITTNKIVTNAITTGHISAGAVKTAQIDAGAVTAMKMTIGDFTNLIPNAQFSNGLADWVDLSPAGFVTAPYSGADGNGVQFTKSASATTQAWIRTLDYTSTTHVTPVKGGEQLYISCKARRLAGVSGGAVGIATYIKYADATPMSSHYCTTTSTPLNTTVPVELILTVPANAASIAFAIYYGSNSQSASGSVAVINPICRRMNGGELIIDGAIKSNHLTTTSAVITGTAQIADAIITNAKIVELSAAKLIAGTALAGSITVAGTALADIKAGAEDPALAINTKSTQIDPGKVLISGGTTLANWRNGSDSTKIEGGSIAANTITANKLTIGSRGVVVDNIEFEHNAPDTNKVRWTAGTISYVDDTGTNSSVSVTADNATWTSNTLYLYWVKGATTISSSTNFATANGENNLVLATYQGGVLLTPQYGRTVIDGATIKTGTITASQIAAGAITASMLSVTVLSALSANMGNLTAGEIRDGTGKFLIDATNRRIVISDNT